uniref:Mortality factor 4-like protein 2 n=1 Tax=Cavia porcellus TaxID=10141 RepID=A0A286XEW1_CAVPO
MSSRKQGSQTHEQQSAEEGNFKQLSQSNMQRSKIRRVSLGKKTAGPWPKNLEPALPGRWGSVRKTRKNKQKTPGNGDCGSTSEEAFKNRMEVKVKIPEELKPRLVEDWDLVTRQKQLFQLPVKKSVDAILKEYECAIHEVVAGIKEYFNVILGAQLLYKFERPQYTDILLAHPEAPILFIRIGAILANTPLDEKSLALLLGYFHDFIKYLKKNSASLFTASDSKVASADHHRKAL